MKYYHWLYSVITIMFIVSGFYHGNNFTDYIPQIWIELIALNLFMLGYAWVESGMDAKKHLSGGNPEKSISAILRLITAFIIALIMMPFWSGVTSAIGSLGLFGVVFNIRLNLLIGKEWSYTGTTSWLDRNLKGWVYPVYSVLFILSLWLI